ncbi:unnamed protein product [Nippostrongylus brasiliensis]|uniref:Transducin beta-like protein 2 (inferred by orthology to a human protein) n=1 Tax=Nippostrongylus brasiliensis TaxID=27835 RepID=A0A0N4YQG0_NIPBR|nr:unnamed protein product [Nippostrongylus brasiliensis]
MINFEEMDLPTMLSAFVGVLVILITSIIYFMKKESEHTKEEDLDDATEVAPDIGDQPNASKKASKGRNKNDQWKAKTKDASYDHPWSVTTLKGHTTNVTGMDFAQDGKKFVTVSTDRAAFLWDPRVGHFRLVVAVVSAIRTLYSFCGDVCISDVVVHLDKYD